MKKSIVKIILSTWAIALPVRIMAAYSLKQAYIPCIYDILFIWQPLLVFGAIIFAEELINITCKLYRSATRD